VQCPVLGSCCDFRPSGQKLQLVTQGVNETTLHVSCYPSKLAVDQDETTM
jgi:hypothetical protein